MPLVTGTTRMIALLGHPVGQVRSPTVMNEYFAANGIDRVVAAFDVRPGGGEAFLKGLRDWENCDGCVITVPYKQAALAIADEATDRARLIGASNVIKREADGRLIADMYDGLGYIAALADKSISVKGMNAVLVGAGGVGSAIAHALGENGAARIAVLDIDADRQKRLCDALRATYPGLVVETDPGPVGELDLVANGSPIGMNADDPHPFPLDGLSEGAVVTDVVTKPPVTPWLEAARARGHRIQIGTDMAEAQQPLIREFLGVT